MSSGKGNRSADEAAITPVYLALLPPGCKDPQGKMLVDKEVHEFWWNRTECSEVIGLSPTAAILSEQSFYVYT